MSAARHSLHTWSLCSGRMSAFTSDLMLSLQHKTLCSDPYHSHQNWCTYSKGSFGLQQLMFSEDSGYMGCDTVWLVRGSWHFEGLLDPEHESTMILWNDGNYLPTDREQRTCILLTGHSTPADCNLWGRWNTPSSTHISSPNKLSVVQQTVSFICSKFQMTLKTSKCENTCTNLLRNRWFWQVMAVATCHCGMGWLWQQYWRPHW
jgi:hypothetical protein